MDIDIMAIVKQKAEAVEARRLEAVQKQKERADAIAARYRRLTDRMDELQKKLQPLLTLRVMYKHQNGQDTANLKTNLIFIRKDTGPIDGEKEVGMAILILTYRVAIGALDVVKMDQKEMLPRSLCRVIMRNPDTEACEVYIPRSTNTPVLCMEDALKKIAEEVGTVVVPDEVLVQKVQEEKIKRKPRGRSIVIPDSEDH